MPKVLVTGGAGFIGSHLVDKLMGSGENVVVLDNLFSGSLKNVETYLEDDDFRFVKGDIRDFEVLKGLVKDVDYVVHLAAITSVPFSMKEPVLTHEVNVTGTLKLLKACLDSDVKRFVFTSSCAVYGEPVYLPVDEKHPVSPVSPYGTTKLAAEYYCMVFYKAYGLETVVLRLFNVYGPRQGLNGEGGVIAKFMEDLRCRLPLTIYGDGKQTRDFVHVNDVADAVLLALKSEKAVGEVFNIGSGKPTRVNDLAKASLNLTDDDLSVKYEKPRLGDVKHSFANIEKAEKQLEFRPQITLNNGLKLLVDAAFKEK